jgi:hypothetical protein
MNKVLFLASVLSMTLSSCAIADYEWEGYNSRLLENSEIRDLSSDACSELETASELVLGTDETNFQEWPRSARKWVMIAKSNGKYLNIHCFGSDSWVEIIPEEEFIKIKQAYDTMKQNEKDKIATELDGLL